jgi:hypothetical protein
MSVRGSALFNSVYQSCRNTNRDLKDSFFGSSKLTPSSITASKTPEAFDNFQNDFKEAKLDLEFRWQGLYLGVLKVHRFDTDNLFAWITTLDKATKLNFSSTLYSHFLLRAEKITLSYMSSEKSNSVIVGNLEVVDCSTASNGKASVNSRDHSFSNRVEIEGLDSYSMNNSMSSDDSSLFKSAIGFGSDEGKTNYSEYCMFSLDPLPQSGVSGEPQALKVKFETEGILSLGISIHKIKINFDMDSFKMMTDRVAMYDEIMNVCQLVANEKRRGESEAFKQNEARLLFEGLSAYDFKQVISDLDKLQAGLKEEKIKNEFIKLFNIVLPHTLAQAQTAKIDVDISGIEFKVGGIIDAGLNKQAFVLLRAGGIHLLIQKMVLLSWKNSIEVGIETEIGRQLCLQITGDKENLIGIDEQKMIVKLSAVDVHLSPAIFEGILTIVQYIATKLSRLEYNHQKYQIIGSLEALLDLQKKTYVTFSEELEINSKVRAIEQELLSAPAFVEKLYVYLGKVSLKIFDEEITKDIIESSIAQRRRLISDFEDWTVIDEDEVERPYQDIALSDIEKKEKELKQLNVVIHLELKPIMVVQKIGRNPSLMLFIHTIMLLDGMTYLNMKENKLNYQTHFCEIYSINYNQPCFDANLSKRFRVTECIRMFHEVHKRFKTEKPFLQLEQKLDYDIEHQRHIQKTEINMSSIIFRLSMATSKETFVCLIRIVDSTLARLDAISDLFTKLREANTTEDMKAFHEKQSQKAMMKNQEKVMEMGSIFSFDVDSIFLDIFDPSRYRLVLKVAKSHISVDDNPSLKSPIKIECNSVQAAFTTKRDFTGKKDVDDFLNKEIYFKVLKLHTMIVGITTDVEDKVPTTDITITLPSNEEKKNLLLMIDLDSLAVFMEISATFTSLLESARSKTQFLFKDLSEYRDRFPEVPPKRESLDWEKVGVKYPEVMAMKDHFKLISDGMTESFQMDTDSKDEKESIQSKIQGNIHKMDESLKVLENIYIEKLSDKVSNLNLKLTIDKITVNIYQQYDFISHSYVSLKIFGLLFVMRSTSSSCETSRKSEKTVVTSSRILSLRSLKILDNTKDSWFKYLLKVPKHSLCLFFRDRTVSEKTVKKESTLQKPTYLVESYKDKVAFIMDLNPIEIFLDDKSADSLKTFTERLIEMLKAKTPEESLYQSEATGMKEDRKSQEASFLLDYFFISNLSLQLIARSATNLSFVNYIPDVNINIDVGSFHCRKKCLKLTTLSLGTR